MEIVWSNTAKKSLALTLHYIRANFGDSVAQNVRIQIEQQVNQLAMFPLMGTEDKKNSTRNRQFRYIVIKRRSKVFYYVQNNRVNIAHVWDTRQNINSLTNLLSK